MKALIVGALLTAGGMLAQTASEQLQKGIFTQETAGDIDGAITIYRQLVNSGATPRDVAAQAEYRLGQALLQKGNLSDAAGEFDKLARNYPDYAPLVANLANAGRSATFVFRPGQSSGTIPQEQLQERAKAMAELQRQVREQEERLAAAGGPLTADEAERQQMLASRKALDAVKEQLNALRAQAGSPPVSASASVPGALRVGGNVAASNLLSQPKAVYPALAKAARVQGTVRFEATIDKEGKIANLQLVSGPPLLVQAAMDAVRQWTYKPTLLNGQPVAVVTTVDVNFTLSE